MNLKRSDVLVTILVVSICLLLGCSTVRQQSRSKSLSSRLVCVENLKWVGLGFRLWPGDGDQYPMKVPEHFGGAQEAAESGEIWKIFGVMSNDLASPRLLVCPDDARRPADSWSQLSSNDQISYFVGLEAEDVRPNLLLSGDRNLALNGQRLTGVVSLATNSPLQWTPDEIHRGQGNIGFADGSVQQVTTESLRKALTRSGDSTNRLIFP
jgi:prepilin-type processing-associated H-X9-DG protein